MADRIVRTRLEIAADGLIQGLRRAQSAWREAGESARQAGQEMDKTARPRKPDTSGLETAKAQREAAKASAEHADALSSLGTKAGLAGTATMAGVGMVIKSYADFDQAMSNVQASTHASGQDMDKLRGLAVQMGADTAFSAKEAAQGIDELAKAGVSTADIMGGGLKGAMSLAAAGQLDVGKAAEIAASAMTQFGLKGTQVEHVADLLAAGAGKAQGSVEDMGMALNQAGLIASQSGLSIEETTGTLAAFASAGLTGSDAGTSFKTMLQRLQNPSKEAQAALDDLGVSMYDSQGKFVGMANLAGQLKTGLAGMSEEQRNAAMATIFGSDAVRAANVLYVQGSAGIGGWTAKVNDAGYAAETARLKQDNLRGDLEKLGGSMDSVFLKSGSGANDALRGLVQGLERLVDIVGQVPGPVLQIGLGLTALGGAVLLGVAGFTKFSMAAAETKMQLATLAAGGSRAATGILAAGEAARAAGTNVQALGAKAGITGEHVSGLGKRMAALATASMAISMMDTSGLDNFGQDADKARDGIDRLKKELADGKASAEAFADGFSDIISQGQTLNDVLGHMDGSGQWLDELVIGAGKFMGLNVHTQVEKATAKFQELDKAISGMSFDKASAGFQALAKQTDGSKESLARLLDQLPQFRGQLEQMAQGAGMATDKQTLLDIAMGKVKLSGDAAATGLDGAKGAMSGMGAEAEEAAASLDDIVDSLQSLGLIKVNADLAVGAFAQAVRDAAKAATELAGQVTITNGRIDATSEAGMKAVESLSGLQEKGYGAAKALAESGASASQVSASLQGTYTALVTAGQGFGLTKAQAEALAREMLNIPKDLSVKTAMDGQAKSMAEATKTAVDGVPTAKSMSLTVTGDAANQVRGIIDQVNAVPAGKDVLITSATTPEVRGQLEALGLTVRTLPNGNIVVTDNGTAETTKARIQAVAKSPYSALVDAHAETGVAENQLRQLMRPLTQTTTAIPNTGGAEGALNFAARPRTAVIDVVTRNAGGTVGGALGGLASGGMPIDIPGYASGGVIGGTPPSDKRLDNILGITEKGSPILVRSREFIMNEDSTRANIGLLRLMNAHRGRNIRDLIAPGFAAGGQYSAAPRTPSVILSGGETQVTQQGASASDLRAALEGMDLHLSTSAGVIVAKLAKAGARQARFTL